MSSRYLFLTYFCFAVVHAADRPLSDDPARVLYQVYLETFQDGDLKDGTGDLHGFAQRLPYLKELGITGVLLMPVFDSTGGMGYIPNDYYKVRRDYGGLDGLHDTPAAREEVFRQVVDAAHRAGIKIYLDTPINHINKDSKWFHDSEARKPGFEDYFVWTATPPTTWNIPWDPKSTWKDIFHLSPLRKEYYYALFGTGMPDLNHRSPVLQRQISDFFNYWSKLGADGFRIDAAKHLVEGQTNANPVEPANLAVLKLYLSELRKSYPNSSFLLEAWNSDPAKFEAYLPDSGDVAFDFAYMETLRDSVSHDHPWAVRNHLKHIQSVQPGLKPGNRIVFAGNHDVARIRSAFGNERRRVEIALALTFLQASTPLIYYGDEIFMPGRYLRPPQGNVIEVASPMAWSAAPNAGFADPSVSLGQGWNKKLHADWKSLNVQSERADPQSLLNLVKKLIELRKSFPIESDTELLVSSPDPSDPVLSYGLHFADGSCAFMMINFTNTPKRKEPLGLTNICELARSDEVFNLRAKVSSDTQVDLDAYGIWVGHRTAAARP